MFGLSKKEENTESIKDSKIELQESSSSTTPITGEVATYQHTYDYKCNHVSPPVSQPPPLTHKDISALNRSQYDKIANKFKTAYLLQNTKTGQMVEINAASPVHACNIIGWRPRQVKIISTKEIKETK